MTIQQIVIKRLKLFTKRRAVSLLDGNYDSIFRGKGVELDSLRPYAIGDNTKDIDWRATARTGTVHTRLYTPLRDQRIVVICDTTPSMLVKTYTEQNKLDMAYGLIVTLGMFVKKNRDLLATCHADATGAIQISKFSNTNNHIEKLLRSLDVAVHTTPPTKHTTLPKLLHHTQHHLKQRTAIFVVSDALPDAKKIKPLLNKLQVKHQVFWLQLAPSWPFTKEDFFTSELYDIETNKKVPLAQAHSSTLQNEWKAAYANLCEQQTKVCKATGSAYGRLEEATKLPEELRKMFMQARRYAKQR